jgi:hypothetical protein
LKHVRGKGDRATPEVFLAAFGKHPGWDDHIEDIGIETDHLAGLKQLLYVQGLGGTIDSGAWDSLSQSQRIEGFRHVFLCRTAESVVVGRLWSSTDGKGRTRYPMVVCAECSGLSLRWVVQNLMPRLAALQERCVAVRTAGEVIAAVDEVRQECRQAAATEGAAGGFIVSPKTLSDLADRPEMGPDHQGLLRILYQMQREMPGYLRGRLEDAARKGELRPIQMRLPACGSDAGQVILQWLDFLFGQLDPAAEIWAIAPVDQPWVDIFVGEPAPQQFFCFQASREALPLASEIPYTLDEAFLASAEGLIKASRDGTAEPVVVPSQGIRLPRRRVPAEKAGAAIAGGRKIIRVAVLLVLAAALIAGIVIAAVALWPPPTTKPPGNGGVGQVGKSAMAPADAKAWADLCNAFWEWFDPFLAGLDKERQARWAQDPHLSKDVLPNLLKAKAGELALDPRQIANVGNAGLKMLGGSPPTAARTKEAIAQTKAALQTVHELQRALSPAGWPELKALADLAAEYKQRGWAPQAAYLASVSEPAPVTDKLGAYVDHAVAAIAKAQALRSAWQKIDEQRKALEGVDDGPLKLFGQYAVTEGRTPAGTGGPSAADLDALAGRLKEVQDRGERLAEFVVTVWKKDVDQEMVKKDPPVAVPADPKALTGAELGQLFESWRVAVSGQKYERLKVADDPRQKDAWSIHQKETLDAIQKKIGELAGKGGKAAEVDGLNKRLKDLRAELAAIDEPPWNQVNKPAITRQVADFAAKPAPLQRDLGTALASVIGGITAYLASIPATISQSAAINDFWKAHVEELKKIQDLGQLMAKVGKLEADLVKLEGELSKALPGKPAEKKWNTTLATEVFGTQRENVLKKALSELTWQDGAIVPDPKFQADWPKLRQDFDKWGADLAALMAALNVVEAGLNIGALGTEQITPPGKPLEQVFAQWKATPIAQDPAVAAAIKPLTERVDRLAVLAKLTDRKELVREALDGQAVSGRFESVRAAWKRLGERLGEMPGWPASPEEFDQEEKIQARLTPVYGALPGKSPEEVARKAQLVEELTGESRRRWRAYFASCEDTVQIEKAISRMDKFYLDRLKPEGFSPVEQFRLALFGLRGEALAPAVPADDAKVKAQINAFQAVVGKLPDGLAAKPRVDKFLADLGKIADTENTGADLGKAGPATPRGGGEWKATKVASDSSSSAEYAWTSSFGGGQHELTFVRVEPKGGTASYISTTEVSVGLFIDVVKSLDKWQEMKGFLRNYASAEKDERLGPRTWELDRGTIGESKIWCPIPVGLSETDFYARGTPVGTPSRDHPIQYVTPQAAAFLALLVGTRLPSSAEWALARALDGDAADPPNLRDQTWLKQTKHVAEELESKRGLPTEGLYPDGGIFWPKGMDRVEGAKAETWPSDDGLLWFAKVNAGKLGRFRHLVGNVAEFVFEDPAALAKVEATKAGVEKLFSSASEKVRVIGGSALSSPKVKVDTAQPVDAKEMQGGFSDVGFRLAFTAPAEPLYLRLSRLLADQGYLTGQPK